MLFESGIYNVELTTGEKFLALPGPDGKFLFPLTISEGGRKIRDADLVAFARVDLPEILSGGTPSPQIQHPSTEDILETLNTIADAAREGKVSYVILFTENIDGSYSARSGGTAENMFAMMGFILHCTTSYNPTDVPPLFER